MGGCLHLLQIWTWERIHVGRPTLRVPIPRNIAGKSLGFRWNEDQSRELPIENIALYRDELDGLRQSQINWNPYTPALLRTLAGVCSSSSDIWTARSVIICWKRAEWYMPDRVMRQFGGIQYTTVEPIPKSFKRVDGRGRADTDWFIYHQGNIAHWNSRREHITPIIPPKGDGNAELREYLKWYQSWASLYLLTAPTITPETYYPRSPSERLMAEYCQRTVGIANLFYGGHGENASSMQMALNEISELSKNLRRTVNFDASIQAEWMGQDNEFIFQGRRPRGSSGDNQSRRRSTSNLPHGYRVSPPIYQGQSSQPSSSGFDRTPIDINWTIPEDEPIQMPPNIPYMQPQYASPIMSPFWDTSALLDDQFLDMVGPSEQFQMPSEDNEEDTNFDHHDRRARQRQGPDRYTPGSDALPRRHRKH